MSKEILVPKPTGHYRIAVTTGAVGAGASANSEVLQFRWTNLTHFAVITEVIITGMRATTAFAAGTIDIKLTMAREWTASGTGGNDILLTDGDSHVSNDGQLKTNSADSLVTDFRVATTQALGAGTKVLDTREVGLITTHSSGGTGSATPIIGSIYLPHTKIFSCDYVNGQYPMVLGDNEGFVIRATVPATGVWNLGMCVSWTETERKFF